MAGYLQLKINYNDDIMDIQSKETQLINVLNKIKEAKKLEQNLYAIQNFSIIDEKILVSKIKGQIDVLTFGQLLKKYQRVMENGLQKQQQDEANVILPQKAYQQSYQPKFSGKDSYKDQLEKFDLMKLENELLQVKQNLVDSQSRSEKYFQDLNHYKSQIWSLEPQIRQLEFEKQRNLDDIKKLETKNALLENYVQELNNKLNQNRSSEVDQFIKSNNPQQQNQQIIDNLSLRYEERIKSLNKQIEDLKISLDRKEKEYQELKQQQQKDIKLNQVEQIQNNNSYEIEALKNKLETDQVKQNKLQADFNKLLDVNKEQRSMIQNFEQTIQSLENKIKNQENEIQQLQQLLDQQVQFNRRQEQNIDIINNQYKEFVKKTKDTEEKYNQNIINLKDKLTKMKNTQFNEPKVKDNLDQVLVHIASNMMISQKSDDYNQKLELFIQENQRQSEIERAKMEQRQQQLKNQKLQQQLKEEQENKEKQDIKAIKNENMKYNQIQALKTHGSIDICFVVDCTQSMDPHKESVIQCINQAIQLIKSQTNRDCNWAAVAYKDVDYLQVTKEKSYPQQDFNSDPRIVQQFLKNQKCTGGADIAEDLQLGLRQSVKLTWKSVFRVVMVITDAPCHGEKYYDNVSDDFPDRTIEEELDMIIKSKIFLIGIELPTVRGSNEKVYTKKMFEYFKQYFELKSRLDKIEIMEYNKDNKVNMFNRFTALLTQAAESMTQVTNKNTKTKGLKPMSNLNCDGAVQALCKKMPDPSQFDKMPDVKIKQCKFTVYRSEFKQVAFERCINRIWDLGNNKDDYNIQKEDTQWDCVRTYIHFAEGQMKKVYLMKRFNREQEVYVIKSPISGQPYQSFDEALRECRSHLIAKLFMKRFKETCLDAREEKRLKIEIPQIQYSDFLILEEDGKQFWIAERFFKGEFVKYNNNNGFIDDSKSNINNFSQAFSVFTYFDSDSTMMICDIQGMGPYFTDPAINTAKGGFDDTDIGLDGINNYLVNFKGKKIGYEYIDLLEIQLEK